MHILYVEDSATMRHATQKMLKPYFKNIDTAVDGVNGLDLYRRFHIIHERNYDIVITDLEMPNMGGKELSESLLSIDPTQEIVVISSSNELALLIDLMNIGVKKFLSKPITQTQLHTIICDVTHNIRLKKLKADELYDITQHNALLKRREDVHLNKLQKSLKELSEFNDALNESSIVSKTDPQGIITYVNTKFCEISSYSAEELIGQRQSIVKSGVMSPSFYARLWHTITRQKSYKGIFQNKSKDGKIYYIESLIKPIVNIEGEIVEFIAISYDITKMMHSIEIAKKAEKEKDDFFRNISHEMRTPLNSILGFTSLLKRRAKDDTKLLNMLSVIENNSQNLAHLIESILDLQRLQRNNLKLQIKEFDTSALYTSLIKQNESKAIEKNITFEYSIDSDFPPSLIGDEKRIYKTIMVFIDNAFKFTLKNGRVNFNLTYSYDDSMFIAQVSDSGIGISLEDQEKIFKVAQLDGSLSRKHEGAGLGLTIANALIKKMGGSFTVHSVVNEGSTFLIELPLQRP